MSTYASVDDFEAYVEGWVTDDEPALERLLEKAERDVDSVLGPIPIPTATTTGLKVDPDTWLDWEAAALSRAVCAQAIYRHLVGDTELVAGRLLKSEKGPDFTREYFAVNGAGNASSSTARPLISPRVRGELAPIAHRRRLGASLR